jgi:hypothetical protein
MCTPGPPPSQPEPPSKRARRGRSTPFRRGGDVSDLKFVAAFGLEARELVVQRTRQRTERLPVRLS